MLSDNDRGASEVEQHQERAARQRIELAEEYVHHYRARMFQIQETFYAFAAHEGVADDPGFRSALNQVTDLVGETTQRAGRKIDQLEEEYPEMTRTHRRD